MHNMQRYGHQSLHQPQRYGQQFLQQPQRHSEQFLQQPQRYEQQFPQQPRRYGQQFLQQPQRYEPHFLQQSQRVAWERSRSRDRNDGEGKQLILHEGSMRSQPTRGRQLPSAPEAGDWHQDVIQRLTLGGRGKAALLFLGQ